MQMESSGRAGRGTRASKRAAAEEEESQQPKKRKTSQKKSLPTSEKNNKNEILLGVNIMRPVPGHPDLTDLMSVSQVSSTMVPQFLAFRIGMMGLEDFFKNVRKP